MKNFRIKKLCITLCSVGLAFTLFACGDDISSLTENNESSSSVGETFSSDFKKNSSSSKEGSFSSNENESSSSYENESSSSYEKVDISQMKSISGLAQIGAFKVGADVKVYELDRDYLMQTGRVFSGKVSGENGEFTIENIPADVVMAKVEVDGFYTDKFRKKLSSTRISISTLVDMNNASNVKVNPITTMGYDRAVYLFVNNGLSINEARKQGELEVLKTFELADRASCFDKWNIVDDNTCTYALGGIILLMEMNEGDVGIMEVMTKFSADLKTDGVVNDSATFTKMADIAKNNSYLVSGNLDLVPSHDRNITDLVLNHFWSMKYGLGECIKELYGTVLGVSNSFSEEYYKKSRDRYICGKNGGWAVEVGIWTPASVVERNVANWEAPEACEVRQGEVDPEEYFYYKYNSWLSADDPSATFGRCCVADNVGESHWYEAKSNYYVCKAQNGSNGSMVYRWNSASVSDYINSKIPCNDDNQGVAVTPSSYVYTCTKSGWNCTTSQGGECPDYYKVK